MILPFYAGKDLRERLPRPVAFQSASGPRSWRNWPKRFSLLTAGPREEDLKPPHVLLGEDGQVRVFNFGKGAAAPGDGYTGRDPISGHRITWPRESVEANPHPDSQCEVYAWG